MKEIAAVILEDGDRVLIGQRNPSGSCGNLWEFPGGKREVGETLEQCAVRECYEELAVKVELSGLFDTVVYQYSDGDVYVAFFTGKILEGVPRCLVHQKFLWVERTDLSQFDFCPANGSIVSALQQTRKMVE